MINLIKRTLSHFKRHYILTNTNTGITIGCTLNPLNIVYIIAGLLNFGELLYNIAHPVYIYIDINK